MQRRASQEDLGYSFDAPPDAYFTSCHAQVGRPSTGDTCKGPKDAEATGTWRGMLPRAWLFLAPPAQERALTLDCPRRGASLWDTHSHERSLEDYAEQPSRAEQSPAPAPPHAAQ